MRKIVWFSNGAASAVTLMLAQLEYGSNNIVAVLCETNSEHPDNVRFRQDVERWLGLNIHVIRSKKYHNLNDVITKTRYLRGRNGARCTTELKKIPRYDFQEVDDIHLFGYTADEQKRIVKFINNNPELTLDNLLLSYGITKEDCYVIIKAAGIELPVLYKLGFKNNNCIGCVKSSSIAYWLRVRKYFPRVFRTRARQERMVNFALCRWKGRPIFLDEFDLYIGTEIDEEEESINCDFLCGTDEESQ